MLLFDVPQLDKNKLEQFVRTKGKSGQNTLKVLASHLHFITAWNTETGYEVLKYLVKMYEEDLMKLSNLHAPDETKIEFVVVGKLIDKISTIIKEYSDTVENIDRHYKGE